VGHLDVSRPDGSTIVAMVPDTAELGMPRGYPILRSGLHIDIGLIMIYIIIYIYIYIYIYNIYILIWVNMDEY
jgi:hypothetical protein